VIHALTELAERYPRFFEFVNKVHITLIMLNCIYDYAPDCPTWP
jgi:hypothetical protein